jgi:hypothetical protein
MHRDDLVSQNTRPDIYVDCQVIYTYSGASRCYEVFRVDVVGCDSVWTPHSITAQNNIDVFTAVRNSSHEFLVFSLRTSKQRQVGLYQTGHRRFPLDSS